MYFRGPHPYIFYGCMIKNVAKAILGYVLFQGPVNVQVLRCSCEVRHGGVGGGDGRWRQVRGWDCVKYRGTVYACLWCIHKRTLRMRIICLLFSADKSRSSNTQGFFVCNLWAVFGDVSKHRGILEYAGSPSPRCCVPSVEKLNFAKLLLHNFSVPWPTRCTGHLVCRLSL